MSTALVAVLVARWSFLARKCNYKEITDVTGSALIVLAFHSSVWSRFTQGYPGDSIHTLTPAGRLGLVVLSSLLVLLLLKLSRYKSHWLQQMLHVRPGVLASGLILDLLLTALLFAIALTVVPQLYYSYYHLLFDLPRQWVIKPVSLSRFGHLFRVSPESNLATHAVGLVGWWLLITVTLGWLRKLRLIRPAWGLAAFAALVSATWHHFV